MTSEKCIKCVKVFTIKTLKKYNGICGRCNTKQMVILPKPVQESKNFLNNPEVIEWIHKNGIFKSMKLGNKDDMAREKKWGQSTIKRVIKQWTTELSETIVKEILLRRGSVWRPDKKEGHEPDWETDDAIYEVKTRSWSVSGTAGQKILGTPFKYAEVPIIYKKPLYIVLVAYQEYEAIEKFKLFDDKCSERQYKMMNMWKDMDIHYVKCSDLLK